MKITIDTTLKTIELHGEVSISELNETLVKLLGDSVNEYKVIQPLKVDWRPFTAPINIPQPVPVPWVQPYWSITSPHYYPPTEILCGGNQYPVSTGENYSLSN